VAVDCVRAGQRRAVPPEFWSQVEPKHHVGMQHGQQRVEVAGAGGGEERVDDPALQGEVGVGLGGGLHPLAGPAGQLARGVRGPFHDLRDLRERHREDVVQHEREPLRGGEAFQHDQQRQPDRIGQYGLMLGSFLGGQFDERLW
jgi:hypothetical protein